MNFTHEKSSGKNFTGIAIVILIHAIAGYAIVSGLGKRIVTKMAEAVETKIIEEVKPPPPKNVPPPPPPPEMKAPPPPFIPPVEVNIQQPAVVPNAIAVTSSAKPATTEIQRTVTTTAAPAPAAPKAVARTAAVYDVAACEQPQYPKNSQRNEETGTSELLFTIGTDGSVIKAEVAKTSGFRDLDRAAINAISKCKFKPGTVDGKPEQSTTRVAYVWKLDQ